MDRKARLERESEISNGKTFEIQVIAPDWYSSISFYKDNIKNRHFPITEVSICYIENLCIAHNVRFEFRQCGTHFIKDGKQYTLAARELCSQARKANIDC